MNWDAIGAIGEVAGAIAVVVTLVYLARQIRHSTEATRIAAYHQGQEQLWSIAGTMSASPELADILARSLNDGFASLDYTERVRLEAALSPLYFGFESMLTLYEQGHIDSELWHNVFDNNFRLIGSKLGREYLATRPGSISRRLEVMVDECLEKKEQDSTR
jgi:hypothetical protein